MRRAVPTASPHVLRHLPTYPADPGGRAWSMHVLLPAGLEQIQELPASACSRKATPCSVCSFPCPLSAAGAGRSLIYTYPTPNLKDSWAPCSSSERTWPAAEPCSSSRRRLPTEELADDNECFQSVRAFQEMWLFPMHINLLGTDCITWHLIHPEPRNFLPNKNIISAGFTGASDSYFCVLFILQDKEI